jgi:hypothetical protein
MCSLVATDYKQPKQLVELNKAKQNAQDTYELYQSLTESFNILQGDKIKLEQECEMWKNLTVDNGAVALKYQQQLDQLKAEVKSKTEYIQEQRDIINQYSKEIEMYKKCQGKRASKREEELKAENEDLKKSILQECPNCGEEYLNYKGVELYYENNDLKQTLTEIKEIVTKMEYGNDFDYDFTWGEQILQKISEVKDG